MNDLHGRNKVRSVRVSSHTKLTRGESDILNVDLPKRPCMPTAMCVCKHKFTDFDHDTSKDASRWSVVAVGSRMPPAAHQLYEHPSPWESHSIVNSAWTFEQVSSKCTQGGRAVVDSSSGPEPWSGDLVVTRHRLRELCW